MIQKVIGDDEQDDLDELFESQHRVKFLSIGQEEIREGGGKRKMLVCNTEISSDLLLEKN